ncbi:MAG: hypothetical protein ACT4PG_02420 [Panacagrimonas sp.]
MNRSPGRPPAGAVGALIAAVGLGVAGWYGWDWYQLPRWSEADIRASVELNLALDLSRTPQAATTVDAQNLLRQGIRRELEAEIARERETPRAYTLAGMIMMALGVAQMLIRTWLARR